MKKWSFLLSILLVFSSFFLSLVSKAYAQTAPATFSDIYNCTTPTQLEVYNPVYVAPNAMGGLGDCYLTLTFSTKGIYTIETEKTSSNFDMAAQGYFSAPGGIFLGFGSAGNGSWENGYEVEFTTNGTTTTTWIFTCGSGICSSFDFHVDTISNPEDRHIYSISRRGQTITAYVDGTLTLTETNMSINNGYLEVGGSLSNIEQLNYTLYNNISCSALDLICNMTNFLTWFFVPNFKYSQGQLDTYKGYLMAKIPFAYVNAALNMDLTGIATEDAIPDFTMHFASTPAVVTSNFTIASIQLPDATGHDDGRIHDLIGTIKNVVRVVLVILLIVYFWSIATALI